MRLLRRRGDRGDDRLAGPAAGSRAVFTDAIMAKVRVLLPILSCQWAGARFAADRDRRGRTFGGWAGR